MSVYSQTLIIIPTYNEAHNIQKILRGLQEISSDLSVLVIDDNSPDQTAQLVKEWSVAHPRVRLLQRQQKLGLGTAYIAGFRYAIENGFAYVFEMDADFSHDPEDIPRFLEAAAHYDLVIGSRYVGGIRIINWPLRRLLLSYFAAWYTRAFTGMPLKDGMSGYKCLSRRALELLPLEEISSDGYAFQIEVNYLLWNRLAKIKEIPIVFYERRIGHSKMNWSVIWEAVWIVPWLRLKKTLGPLLKKGR